MYTWMRYPALLLTLSVTYTPGAAQDRVRVTSPDGRNQVTVEIRDGALTYSLDRDGRAVLLPSRLGFAFQGAPPLRDSLRMVDTSRNTVDETWTQPWVRLPGCAITTTSYGSPSPRSPPPAGGSWWRSGPSMTGSASATSCRRSPGSASSPSPTS